jgi:cysteinyl-tRNA synthetase
MILEREKLRKENKWEAADKIREKIKKGIYNRGYRKRTND